MSRKSRERSKKVPVNPAPTPVVKAPRPSLQVKPETIGQSKYFETLKKHPVTVVTGCPGTGKSYLAIGLACQYLTEGSIDRIIIARPTVEAAPKSLGALPGELDEKLSPYLYPAVEHMKKFLGKDRYGSEFHAENIRFEALEYMRGRTFDYSFMILEEAQNCTFEQLKMFVTRIGKQSKILINGDTEQTDIKCRGLEKLFNIFKTDNSGQFGTANLTNADIVRNELIGKFLDLCEKYDDGRK